MSDDHFVTHLTLGVVLAKHYTHVTHLLRNEPLVSESLPGALYALDDMRARWEESVQNFERNAQLYLALPLDKKETLRRVRRELLQAELLYTAAKKKRQRKIAQLEQLQAEAHGDGGEPQRVRSEQEASNVIDLQTRRPRT